MKPSPKPDTPAMLAVTDDRVCVGHVLNRGKMGFEAFDSNEKSCGTFPTLREAIAAIPRILPAEEAAR